MSDLNHKIKNMDLKNGNSRNKPAQPNNKYELLSTKLAPPRLRASYVSRGDLAARLDEGLERKLTLISAPAGFGKTTLAGEWIAGLRSRPEAPSIAWITLDASDNDPFRFWHYVLAAFHSIDEGFVAPALKLLQSPQSPDYEQILTVLINDLGALPEKLVLVLEDFHTITSQQIHVSQAETEAFLEGAVPISLSTEIVTRLGERTEGWAAGLRLAALALSSRLETIEVENFLANLTGSHRSILEYLVGDVFSAQPEHIQEFLLQTSILNPLTASLCNAVTGRTGSLQLLNELVSANLFLTPLDGSGLWFRYHDLFAEAMQHYAIQRLGRPHLHELARKAGRWYEEHGMLPEAIEAALYAQDHTRAAGLLQLFIAPRIAQNEYHTLRRWMEELPEEVPRAHPEICMTFAVSILFTSVRHSPDTKERLQLPMEIAEQHWRREENAARLGEVLAFRSLVSWLQRDHVESFKVARQALDLLPPGDVQWRGISMTLVGAEELLSGRLNAAREVFTQALQLCEASENFYGVLDSSLLLAEVSYHQGELHRSAEIYKQVLSRIENVPMSRDQSRIREGRARLGAGLLSLEWNRLEEAEQDVARAVRISRQFPGEYLLAHAPLVYAAVKRARGEIEQAHELLHSLSAQTKWPLLAEEARIHQARYDLVDGNLAGASHWQKHLPQPGWMRPVLLQEQEAMLQARLLVAEGKAGEAVALCYPPA